MTTDKELAMTSATTPRNWLAELDGSRARLLEAARSGRLEATALRRLADHEAVYAFDLHPLPRDPAEHLTAAHAWTRPYLERLPDHDPSVEVFIKDLDGDDGRSYTPRKPLRRVFDHALDHLNQIEQWIAWQDDGVVPVPTDGWTSSMVTLSEDHSPLSVAELDAWLWRIDLVVQMTARRAAGLNPAQLDWVPSGGGWTLRRTLYHLARAERFYAVWLDEALPEETAARYAEGSRRLRERLQVALAAPPSDDALYTNDTGELMTPAQIAEAVLMTERQLVTA